MINSPPDIVHSRNYRPTVELHLTEASSVIVKRKLKQNDDSCQMKMIDFEQGPSLSENPRVCSFGSTAEQVKSPVNNVTQCTKPNTKKKVSFHDNVIEHYFEIDSNKVLKNCSSRKCKKQKFNENTSMMIDVSQFHIEPSINNYPKFEEFINSILQWNPHWLSEKQIMLTEQRVVNSYNSYSDYYIVTAPLILLELWDALLTYYNNDGFINNNRILCDQSSIIQCLQLK